MSSKPASKPVKKKEVVSSSESDSEASSSASSSASGSEDESKKRPAAKKPAPKKAPPKKKAVSSSRESSSESESESDDDKKKKKKPAAAAKKPAPKKKAVSSSSESESESDSEDDKRKKKPVAKKAAPAPKKAAAAPKKPANAFAGLGDEEEEESQSESSSSSSESESEEESKKKPAPKKPAAAEKPAPAAGKKGKKAAAAADDDLDSILNDLSLAPAPAAAGGAVDESQMTKAQLKRLRQKQKAEADKAAGIVPAAAAPAEPKKKEEKKEEKKKEEAAKPTKGNKAVEALKEKLRQQKEEEERRRKEEEERAAAAEAERLRQEEQERLEAEERKRKQEARLKAREQARAEGKLLSKSEKLALAKRQAFIKQLEASGAPLPAALLAEKQAGENALAADQAKTDAAKPDGEQAAPSGPRVSKKEQRSKGKSAFGKRLQAQQEADRIRAERYAAEDKAKAEAKAEDARRKEEDAALAQRFAAQMQSFDDAEAALDDEERAALEEPLEESEEEEEVIDSWEELDEDTEEDKQKEREAKRAAKIAERDAASKVRAEKKSKLLKEREEATRAHEAELAELAKKRYAIDSQRKKREEEERKAEEEKQRQAEAIEKGFEIATPDAAAADSSAASSSAPAKGRKGAGELRSPIICVLGHVDTGKTKIMDSIRQTSVGAGEAGGITQQMGATFLPRANILEKTLELQKYLGKELRMDMPGMLAIDTPGHESFTNLRSRGNNLCDIGILVVDITAGLEQQTIESINLLKQRKTPFIIALNKIDRCYGWKANPNAPFKKTLELQGDNTRSEFEKRKNEAVTMLAQQGLNTVPYYENTDFRKWISIVPTSAMTGEGIPDLLMLLVQLTQNLMNERLTYLSSLSCTVLEVKVVEGLGTTIDVILVNGTLKEGDTIVVCGLTGPIVTTVRALLTPPPMQEIRVKSEFVHHKVVKAAMGVKICAQGLENAVAGSSLLVCGPKDNLEDLKDEVQGDLATILSKVDHSGQGVAVQASTLGSLEALLAFLTEMKIPVSSINIGPVYKKDIMKTAVMLEKKPEYAILLAFDVKVSPDAQKCAEDMGVKIFAADVIYHLFDKCQKYMEEVKERKRTEGAETAVFPVVLDVLPNSIFNVKSPIVLGVRVVEGIARIGTPICIPSKDFLYIGRITGIQKNHQDQTQAKKGEEFACKIEQSKGEQQIVFGRHFDASHQLVSKISRESIDLLKANFKDDLSQADWKLVIKLKQVFNII